MISSDRIAAAIVELSHVANTRFDAKSLVEDVVGAACAFTDPEEFDAAIASTGRMLALIAKGRVDVSRLADDYEGWECCHYQHRASQGTKASMRIMFTREDGIVHVRGFGHRRLPADFYRRMADIDRG